MDPSSPTTQPATQQAQPLPTESEVVEYLLLLGETAGREDESEHLEDFDLEEEHNPVPDESTVEVTMDGEESSGKTLVVTTDRVQLLCLDIFFIFSVDIIIFSFGFILGYDSSHEAQDMKEEVDTLDKEGDEPLKEYFYGPMVITEPVRRCNRNNGRWWVCSKIAHPGYAVCLHHMKNLPKHLKKELHSNELQASSRMSEAVDLQDTAGPSAPEALSGSSAVPYDDAGPA
ncbi:hypothetical protein VPH35_091839 [Triticum aestivum]